MKDFDVILFNNGDTRQLDIVFDEYFQSICVYAEGIIGDCDIAEDIAIDCFVNLWRARKNLASLSKIRAYLYSSAKKACFFHLRKQKRKLMLHQDFVHYLKIKELQASSEENQINLLKMIFDEIDKLPGRCKEIFTMLMVDDMDISQVASQLGTTQMNVRKQKHIAVNKIRAAILKKKFTTLLFNMIFFL